MLFCRHHRLILLHDGFNVLLSCHFDLILVLHVDIAVLVRGRVDHAWGSVILLHRRFGMIIFCRQHRLILPHRCFILRHFGHSPRIITLHIRIDLLLLGHRLCVQYLTEAFQTLAKETYFSVLLLGNNGRFLVW